MLRTSTATFPELAWGAAAGALRPPREGALKLGKEKPPAARFLVLVGPAGVALLFDLLARSSAYSAAAIAFASDCLSAICPISVIARAGCAMMVSASVAATAPAFAESTTDAFATTCVRRAFLGADARASVTGVATRDIIASSVSRGERRVC